ARRTADSTAAPIFSGAAAAAGWRPPINDPRPGSLPRLDAGAPGRSRLDDRGALAELAHLLRGRRREDAHDAGDRPGPAGLVARADPRSAVAVEVLVEQDEVAPVRILLELARSAVDRTAAVR